MKKQPTLAAVPESGKVTVAAASLNIMTAPESPANSSVSAVTLRVGRRKVNPFETCVVVVSAVPTQRATVVPSA